MKLLIDNVGLHSAARTLFGNGLNENDVKGLLQLSNLIIFSNEIHLAGLEDLPIKSRTVEILSKFETIGVDKNIIIVDKEDMEFFKSMCKITADNCASDLTSAYNFSNKVEITSLRPDDLASDSLEALPTFFELLKKDISSNELEQLANKYLETKMDGAIKYMICISEKLRNSLKNIITDNPNLTDNEKLQITTFLRFNLNENISNHRKLKYTPAVGRAQLIRKGNFFVLNQISKVLDKAVFDYTGSSLETPSLTSYLISRSNGSPDKMINIALEAREKATKLRIWVQKLTNKIDINTSAGKFDIQEEMNELSKNLLMDLGVDKPKPFNSLEISLSYGIIPTVKLNTKELMKWLEYKRNKGKMLLLTEISKENIFADLKIDPNEIVRYIKK